MYTYTAYVCVLHVLLLSFTPQTKLRPASTLNCTAVCQNKLNHSAAEAPASRETDFSLLVKMEGNEGEKEEKK